MIELIVVVVIIAIVAAAIVPRLSGDRQRRAANAALEARRILSAAAHRGATTDERIALRHDAESRSIVLRVFRARNNAPAQWIDDPVLPPASFAPLVLREAEAGGNAIDAEPGGSWTFEFSRHEQRPVLTLLFALEDAEPRYRLTLGSSDLEARLDAPNDPAGSTPIDLDAISGGKTPW